MIEDQFDVAYIAQMALREKQIQQNYRPIISVHKWFARRPGTLFRGLLLSEFGNGRPLRDTFCESNQFEGLKVVDPFMGGGTPLIEANRLGCDVSGFDINPMAFWIVHQELEHLDLDEYRAASNNLVVNLRKEVGRLYETTCTGCGHEAPVKYFLWVKQQECPSCKAVFDLSPGYVVAKDNRHVAYVVQCAACCALNEVDDILHPGKCHACNRALDLQGNAKRGKATCPACRAESPYPCGHVPEHRLFALEYYCPRCHPTHKGRFFKSPDEDDNAKVAQADSRLSRMRLRFVPDDEIPAGDETNRLIRWGYRSYKDMFNSRQLIGLELICRLASRVANDRVRNALSTNLSDLLRYQNMLCRYDTMALKSLDIFSVHGFPVSLVQCESNILGIENSRGANVGSGGLTNIIEKYARAKEYCDRPFETVRSGKRKTVVYTTGEWIGDRRGEETEREIVLKCADAAAESLPPNSVDAVVTDPPYFGNVQYAELMDFCYVWLRKLLGESVSEFGVSTTRNPNELTGNVTEGRDLAHFADGLSRVFRSMANAMKHEAPLTFTFHHNALKAYAPVGVAILDANLACTATIPCPAEMGGSIHINGTGSSIIDTVFVCRKRKSDRIGEPIPEHLVSAVNTDVAHLADAGHYATDGDLNCMLFGHLTRIAIGQLREHWSLEACIKDRVRRFTEGLVGLVDVEDIKSSIQRHTKDSGRPIQKRLFDALRAEC